MGKVKRIVNTGFWEDKKVIDDFSVEDRYFMLYLLTNPHTTQLGIYELPISTISNETGYNKDVVRVLIDRFMNKYDVIKYSHKTGEIAIKNYLKHSIVKGGKPVFDCLVKEEKQVSDKSLLTYIYKSLSNKKEVDNITVIDFLNHIKNEIENDKDNDNDNDNERIVNESCTNLALDVVVEKYQELMDQVIKESVRLPKQGEYCCDWCGNMFDSLENHHFPIPKRYGGKKTVSICHTCHKRFHDYETNNKRCRNSIGAFNESSKRFIPPSVEEVQAYCDERMNGIDAEEFVDFYTSKGWMVGKTKMKDWKASIRTWEKSKKKTGNKKSDTNVFDEWRNA